MYNRYIPQPDGTFRRDQHPDAISQPPIPPQTETSCGSPEPPQRPEPPRPAPPPHRPSSAPLPGGNSIGSFLRQIMPNGLDTSDLFVILLLLLMAGDDPENRNNALLTMALYLFL